MGERADGRWATPRVGISVPRQNGKGALIEARELAGLLVFGEQSIVHSAHLQPTARVGFDRIKSYFDNYDDLRKRVKQIGSSLSREYIELKSGQMLRFPARSKSAIRGYSVDCLLLDEAQILGDLAWSAIMPTLSARPNPQVWLLGTPPTESDDGEVFRRFRDSGIEGKDRRLCWCEWSVPDTIENLDDEHAWAQANPAYPYRVSREAIQDERASMDDETFARERLNVWSGLVAERSVIDARTWAQVKDEKSEAVGQMALAVDASPDRSIASVALAGQRKDGLWHVEMREQKTGVGWLVPWLERWVGANRDRIRSVVIDAASPAASVVDELTKRRIKVTTTTSREMAAACGQFYDSVHEKTLRHTDQPQVNLALSVARQRPLLNGESWAWSRSKSTADITPLVAMTLALWGAQSSTVKKIGKSGGRRVLVA